MRRNRQPPRAAARATRHADAAPKGSVPAAPVGTQIDRQIEALLADVGPAVVGERVRRVRTSMGLSIRDVAAQGALSKTSVVRLEQGGACRASTLIRVCDVLGLHVDGLRHSGAREDVIAVHRASEDRWYDLDDVSGTPLAPEHASRDTKRTRGSVAVVVDLLRSRLPDGRVLPTILEVRRESQVRSHPGEEFVYVLSGRLRLTVGETTLELSTGESACFLSGEPHTYAPATRAPARILSVRVNSA